MIAYSERTEFYFNQKNSHYFRKTESYMILFTHSFRKMEESKALELPYLVGYSERLSAAQLF